MVLKTIPAYLTRNHTLIQFGCFKNPKISQKVNLTRTEQFDQWNHRLGWFDQLRSGSLKTLEHSSFD